MYGRKSRHKWRKRVRYRGVGSSTAVNTSLPRVNRASIYLTGNDPHIIQQRHLILSVKYTTVYSPSQTLPLPAQALPLELQI